MTPVALATERAHPARHLDDAELPDARDAGLLGAIHARVDLVRDDARVARVPEPELTEPSPSCAPATGGEARPAAAVAERPG